MTEKKESFVIYKDWQNLLSALSDEQKGKLLDGIFSFQCDGKTTDFDGDKALQGILNYFISAFIKDNEKYEETCEKNRKNGSKGGRPKKTEKTQRFFSKPKKADNDNDNDNGNDNGNDSLSVSGEPKPEKETKHTYGTYKNVLLSDGDLEKLKQKYPFNYTEKIESLSEGIELKGYKYKNHYLAVLKWAENGKKKPENSYATYDLDAYERMINAKD